MASANSGLATLLGLGFFWKKLRFFQSGFCTSKLLAKFTQQHKAGGALPVIP